MQDQDGALAGARFDKKIDASNDTRMEIGDIVGKAALSGDDAKTDANELRTGLKVGGAEFAIGDLLGSGSASAGGKSFVAEAVAKIQKVQADVTALLALDSKPTNLNVILRNQWNLVKNALDPVFNTDNDAETNPTTRVRKWTTRTSDPREEDILGEINDILDALSGEDAFVAATAKTNDGAFNVALSTSKATGAFGRLKWTAMATLGETGSTRYGTVIRKATDDALTAAKYSYGRTTDDPPARNSTGEYGAFSYATMEETQRTRHVQQQTGIATYSGGTHAINTQGVAYTGQMSVQVRFSSNSVSGVVSGLENAEGMPWQHNFTDVDSIVLPTATLRPNAKWSGSASATAPLYIRYLSSTGVVAPHRQVTAATFDGILVGRGANSGSEANGTWSIGTLANGSTNPNYLAGAFGVVRGDDAVRPTPGADDGTTANASTFWQKRPDNFSTDPTSQASAWIEDGMLKVRTDKHGWNAAGDSFGRLAQAAPNASRSQTTTAQFNLADMVSSGASKTVKGDTHVSMAVAEIQKQRGILATLLTLPDSAANTTAKMSAWEAVKNEIRNRVLGVIPDKLALTWTADTHASRLESEALDLIDRVLAALASDSALEAAIDGDGTGIFKDTTGDNTVDPATATGATKAVKVNGRSAKQVRAELEYSVIAQLGSTSLTRFGAWRHTATRNAVQAGSDSSTTGTSGTRVLKGGSALNGPGLVAYSLMDPTVADSVSASYPTNGSARYIGETVAVQNETMLTGEIQADVSWGAKGTENNEFSNARLALTIRNLENGAGDRLGRSVEAGGTTAIRPISEIVISNLTISEGTDSDMVGGTNNGQLIVGAASDAPAYNTSGSVRYNYADAAVPQGTGEGGSVRALFVGQNSEGPVGIIGFWQLNHAEVGRINAAGSGLTDASSVIYGAFGAEAP